MFAARSRARVLATSSEYQPPVRERLRALVNTIYFYLFCIIESARE